MVSYGVVVGRGSSVVVIGRCNWVLGGGICLVGVAGLWSEVSIVCSVCGLTVQTTTHPSWMS